MEFDVVNPTCTVADCEKPARSKSAELCPMHYHRQYRHGSLEATSWRSGISVSPGRRYRTVHRPGHPISPPGGTVYAHRVVLYDAIGPGPHACHWCDEEVQWLPKGSPGALYVDHVNGVGDDNRLENLVPACVACNTARGQQARSDALRAAGWWSENDTVAHLKNGGRRPRVEALSSS